MRPASSLESFASPDHFDPELQLFLEKACLRLCEWFAQAGDRGPLPMLSALPDVAPSLKGLSTDSLLDDLQIVMEGSYQPSHPGALAHLDPPPLTASIVADLICAGLNNNLLANELSPSLSRLERGLCKWFADRIGMSPESGGVAASGGSLSNLMGLVVARQQAKLQNNSNAVVLASKDAHVSLDKAIRVMGLSSNALQKIPTDQQGRICLQSLHEKLKSLRIDGRECFAVVATAGTTVRGAVDPLIEIGKFCSREGLWLHIDGAIGGVFALSKTTSSVVEGMSMADSLTLNPQKLLGIAKTSSLLLVANRAHLVSAFATGLPYIDPAWGDESHGGEMGLQGTRSAEVLKLWLGLRQLGEEGIQNLLEASIYRRSYLEKKLDQTFMTSISGPLHLIACTPKHVDSTLSAYWSKATREKLLEENYMLSRPIHAGRYYLKMVMGNPHTQLRHLDKLASLLNQSMET